MSNSILYTTDDGKSQNQLRFAVRTAWLTQLEMAARATDAQNEAELKAMKARSRIDQTHD